MILMLLHHRKVRRAKRQSASLLLRFALVSGLLTGVFGTVLAVWLSTDIRQNHIGDTRDNATYSLALAIDTAYVPGPRTSELTAAQSVAAANFLRGMVATHKYVGATAYTAAAPGMKPGTKTVGYATESARLGKNEQTRPQLTEAFGGTLVSKVVTAPLNGVPDVTERAALKRFGPLLETFVPVRMDGKRMAAVILYQQWKPVEKQIDEATTEMLLIVGVGSVIVWLGLMGFILSVARQLKVRDKANWRLASHDSLTDLPNRKLIGERTERALALAARTGGSVGLMLIDVDSFKEVNDTLGHHAGDALLQQIGPRLASGLRDSDSVARLGGDEFVILLPALTNAEEAMAAAERVTANFAEPFTVEDLDLDISISIGIAVSPEHGDDFPSLLRHADVGMYAAKHAGIGIAAYSSDAELELANARTAQQLLARQIRPRPMAGTKP
jgi:diguanylate cyclase (GGDEF)-like protein